MRFLEGYAVAGLTTTADRTRVTGVPVAPERGEPHVLTADLVVDATGRGSRTPFCLTEMGYARPEEDRVEIGLAYAIRRLRLRPGALGSDLLVVQGGRPTRGAATNGWAPSQLVCWSPATPSTRSTRSTSRG